MKEHSLIMSTVMLRATIDGLKTQIRQIVKPQPDPYEIIDISKIKNKIKVGDIFRISESTMTDEDGKIHFKVDNPDKFKKWKSPFYFKKDLTRIRLKVKGKYYQRIKDISEEEMALEGIFQMKAEDGSIGYVNYNRNIKNEIVYENIREAFIAFWDHKFQVQTQFKWLENPYVVVYEFDIHSMKM